MLQCWFKANPTHLTKGEGGGGGGWYGGWGGGGGGELCVLLSWGLGVAVSSPSFPVSSVMTLSQQLL